MNEVGKKREDKIKFLLGRQNVRKRRYEERRNQPSGEGVLCIRVCACERQRVVKWVY